LRRAARGWYTETDTPRTAHRPRAKGAIPLQTIETDKTVVNVLVWPSDRPWTGRYATSGTVEDGRCTLVLTERVFRDPKRANAAYRRFARRMERAGLQPPNVVFHE